MDYLQNNFTYTVTKDENKRSEVGNIGAQNSNIQKL
jgi:hypothetical protein